jgi:YbbR domain-containing protein
MNRMRIQGAQFGLAVLLALTLWTYVSFTTNPNTTRQMTVPVDIIGRPEGLIIVNPETGIAESNFSAITTLDLSGPKQVVDQLSPAQVDAKANLENLQPGPNRVRIDVNVPGSIQIRGKTPAELTISAARELARTVPISVTAEGQPPFSYTPGDINQGARETVVRGPEDLVRRTSAAVAQVNLQGQTSNISTTLRLKPVDANGDVIQGVSITPERVSVQVAIVARVQSRQVSVVPDLAGQPAPGYALGGVDWDPKIIDVLTSGAITSTVHTEPITLTGLTSSITRTVGLEPLSNVITQPPVVRVRVRVSIVPINVSSQLPIIVTVSPEGIGAGLTATADPTALRLVLAGSYESLDRLASGKAQVTATVDLFGLSPGTFDLPVKISTPDGLRVISPANPRVRVQIRALPTPTPQPTPTTEATPASTAPPTITATP